MPDPPWAPQAERRIGLRVEVSDGERGAPCTGFDPTRAHAVERRRRRPAGERRRDLPRDDERLGVREHAGPGQRLAVGQRDRCHVADGVDAIVGGLHGPSVDRYPARLVGEARAAHRAGSAVGWHRRQQVVPGARSIGEHQLARRRFKALDGALRVEADPLRLEEPDDGAAHHRTRHGHRLRLRGEEVDLARLAQATPAELVVEQEGRLVGRGWALVRQGAHRDDHPAAAE